MPKPAPGGPKAVTVRGEAGVYQLIGNGAAVTTRTSDGRWLTVVATPSLSADQLVAIADGLRIGAADDPSWSNR